MEHITISEAKAHLSDVVNKVSYNKEHIFLTKHGKPAAVIVPLEDAELLEKIEDALDLQEALKALKEEGEDISHEDLKQELGL